MSCTTLFTQDVARWQGSVREHMFGLAVEPDLAAGDFEGHMRIRHVDGGVIARVATGASTVRNAPQAAKLVSDDVFKLLWQIEGSAEIDHAGFHTRLEAGQMALYRLAQPYQLHTSGRYRMAMLAFDLRDRPEWLSLAERFNGQPLPVTAGGRAGLAALGSLLDAPEDEPLEGVVHPVADLVFQFLWRARREREVADHQPAARLNKVRQTALARLCDPEFSPSQLAQALGVSRRSLYTEFQRWGLSPAAFIRDLRLELCRSQLLDDSYRNCTATEIAFENGFSGSAYFSRAFRARYGVAPTSLRKAKPGAASRHSSPLL
jgi:AraC-like DNA-binding protein